MMSVGSMADIDRTSRAISSSKIRIAFDKIALMLDVRRLRVLKEVAERGSFSAAADALNFTQSAVSQQIAALEKETGTTLLQRGAAACASPTPAGRWSRTPT